MYAVYTGMMIIHCFNRGKGDKQTLQNLLREIQTVSVEIYDVIQMGTNWYVTK